MDGLVKEDLSNKTALKEMGRNPQLSQKLINERLADAFQLTKWIGVRAANHQGQTPLILAVLHVNLFAVQWLLSLLLKSMFFASFKFFP